MQVLQRQQQQPAAMYAPVAYTQQQQLPAHPSRSMTYDYSGMQARTSIDGGDQVFRPPQRLYSMNSNNSTPNLAASGQIQYGSPDPSIDEMQLGARLRLSDGPDEQNPSPYFQQQGRPFPLQDGPLARPMSTDPSYHRRPSLDYQVDAVPNARMSGGGMPPIVNGLPRRPRPSSRDDPNQQSLRDRKASIQSLPARQQSLAPTPSELGVYDGLEAPAQHQEARSRSAEAQMPEYNAQMGHPDNQNWSPQRQPYYAQDQQYHMSPGMIQQSHAYNDQYYQQQQEAGPSNYYQTQFQPQHLDYGQPSYYQQNMQPMQHYNNPGQSLHRNMSSASSLVLGAPSIHGGPSLNHSPSIASMGSSSTTRQARSSTQRTNTNSGQPITKAAIDEYRNRIKTDPDPEIQFNFAKYLIEAARKLGQASAASTSESDAKALKRYRDALLQESLKLIKKLATQSVSLGKPAYADAQFFFANLLSSGSLGLAVDHEKAYNLYVQASKQNHAAATYRTAVCNEIAAGTKRDYQRAVLFYRKASALGDGAGMYKLGMILLNGLLDQQRNGKEAVVWLKRAAQAADEDNPHALHELGLLYEKPPAPNGPIGPTVPMDEAQAFELFMQAAKLGYPPSQHKLGTCYEFGALTCPVDPRRSIAFYTRAAEKGHASSELALSGWYLTGSDGVLKQSDEEAFLWARRAANKGLSKAEYAVGYYFELGIGVKQDVEEAKRWYMRASAQSHKRAMQRLTELKRSAQIKGGKRAARPTRQEASSECVIS